MTLLIRNLQSLKAWIVAGEDIQTPKDPPLAIIREFIPTERDGTGLSFFQVEDENEACIIASAFAFGDDKIDSRQYAFAAVSRIKLIDAGLNIISSRGGLNHKFADTRHVDVVVPDLATVVLLAKIFLSGEFFSFEGKQVGEEARRSAKSEQFHYDHLSKLSLASNWKAKNLLKFITDKAVVVNWVVDRPD